jgi:acyl-CoA synthetase (AMP-forming)/AMP-acid ligase II
VSDLLDSLLIDPTPTLWELVRRRAELSPDRPLLLGESGGDLTCAQFADRCERVAAGLFELGIRPGSPVSWQLPTRIDTVVLSFALARLGAVQNPIIHIYRQREVAFALRRTEAELVCVPGTWRGFDYEGMVRTIVADLPKPPQVLVTDDGLPEGDPAILPPPPTSPDDVRWIYFTSGTTSDPKGVKHSDGTLIAGGVGLAIALDVTPTDVGSIAFPFAHIGGPDYFVMMLAAGFPAVLLEAFDPPVAMETYRARGVTIAGGVTAFYMALLGVQRRQGAYGPVVPTLRMLSGGGAPKPPELFFEVQREMGIPIAHGYGMTEVPMITQGSPLDSDEQLAGSEGAPIRGVQLRLVTADGTDAPTGTEGEVRVRGAVVCHGYLDPEQDAAAFDEDGWFRTGDLGVLRPDGHLTLTGRLKDVIIRKGENISAKEIEDVLYTHPKVAAVAVIGLPDRERGELVCAVVETEPGAAPLAFTEMSDFLQQAGLARYKVPERLEVVAALPRNATAKILKYQLRDELAAARPTGPSS